MNPFNIKAININRREKKFNNDSHFVIQKKKQKLLHGVLISRAELHFMMTTGI